MSFLKNVEKISDFASNLIRYGLACRKDVIDAALLELGIDQQEEERVANKPYTPKTYPFCPLCQGEIYDNHHRCYIS